MENRMKSEWQNQKILVAGMGGSGISMLDFLRRKGAVVAAYDADFPAAKQAELQQRFPGLACHTGYLKPATTTHIEDQNNDRVGFTCRY